MGSRVRRVWIVADIAGTQPGGMRRHMELHARGLSRLGVQTRLVYGEQAARSGIHSIDARVPGLRLLLGTWSRLRSEMPDIVNVHTMSAPAFILAKLAGVLRSRVVVMSYAADERSLVFGPGGTRKVLRRARIAIPAQTFRRASGIWCVAEQDANYYVSQYGVAKGRVRFIPHAIEDDFFERCDVVRQNQVLFVGTWIYRKGIDVLREALAILIRERPDVSVVIAGTLAPDEEIRQYLSLPGSANLRTVSRLDDTELRALYHQSSLLVVPSRLEGMPFSLLEAMACGCPALAAANSGMLDAIDDGSNGWLVDHFDGARWGARLVELFRAPAVLEAASVAARRASERFRLDGLSVDTLRWYESLVDRAD